MNKYSIYKKAIIENKKDSNTLKDMLSFLKSNKDGLSKIQAQNLIDLIISFLDLNFKNDLRTVKTVKTIKTDLIKNPFDSEYLFYLLNQINLSSVNNDYLISLNNLLSDNNYNINYIGLKVNICKYLSKIDIKDLRVLKIKNNYLSDSFKFLVYKNDKDKNNNTKLLFINNLIIINCLDSDRIFSYVIYHKDNKAVNDIMTKNINPNIKSIKISHINIKGYNDFNKSDIANKNIIDILKYLHNRDINNKEQNTYIYKKLNNYQDIDFNNDKDLYKNKFLFDILFKYDSILNNHYYLKDKYQYILDLLSDIDIFKSNDINSIKTTINDYDMTNNELTDNIKINVTAKTDNNKINRFKNYIFNQGLKRYHIKSRYDIDNNIILYVTNRL